MDELFSPRGFYRTNCVESDRLLVGQLDAVRSGDQSVSYRSDQATMRISSAWPGWRCRCSRICHAGKLACEPMIDVAMMGLIRAHHQHYVPQRRGPETGRLVCLAAKTARQEARVQLAPAEKQPGGNAPQNRPFKPEQLYPKSGHFDAGKTARGKQVSSRPTRCKYAASSKSTRSDTDQSIRHPDRARRQTPPRLIRRRARRR